MPAKDVKLPPFQRKKPTASSLTFLITLTLEIVVCMLILSMFRNQTSKKSKFRAQPLHIITLESSFYNSTHPEFLNCVQPFSLLHQPDHQLTANGSLGESKLLPRGMEQRVFNFFFQEYIKFHSTNRYNASRVLIFRPYPSGLGDSFALLLHAYWCAVISNRLLLIDWKRPFLLTDFMDNADVFAETDMFFRKTDMRFDTYNTRFNPHFKSTSKCSNKILIADIDFVQLNTTNILSMLASKNEAQTVMLLSRRTLKSKEMTALAAQNIPPGFEPKDAKYFSRLLGAPEYNFHRAFARHVLKLSDRLMKEYITVCTQMGLRCASTRSLLDEGRMKRVGTIRKYLNKMRPKPQRYISVHARLGVGVGEKYHERFRISQNLSLVATCLGERAVQLAVLGGNTRSKRFRGSPLPIFLATDTPVFREVFRDAVRNISRNRVKVVYGKWSVLHTKRFVLGRAFPARLNESVWGGYKGVWMDLLLTANGEHSISLYSTFPRFALALGDSVSLTELRAELCAKLTSRP